MQVPGIKLNQDYWFDMDYIFKWINPKEDEKYYKFLVSPVTMVFENAYEIRFGIESQNGETEISDLYMDSRKTKNGNLSNIHFTLNVNKEIFL